MASTFTTNKNIEKPAYTDFASDPTGWTNPVNGDWDTIDRAFGGTHSVSLTNANVTLTATQCQNARIRLTGAITANITIFFPTVISGLFVVDNETTGAFVITLASAGAGPESVIAVQSANTLIWLDAATNSVYLADNSPVQGGVGISVSGTIIDLDVPVTVTNGGTGQTNYFPGQLLIGNNAGGLTPAVLSPGANISITNGNGAITIAATGSAGGVTTFSGGTTGFTPNTATAGAVTLAGTLGAANGGTGATTLTGYVKGAGTGVMTASPTVPGSELSGAYTAAALTVASSRLLGRSSGGTGSAEEIAIGTGLSLSGGTLNATSGGVTSVSATSSAGGFSLSSSGSTAVTVTFGISSTSSAQASLGLGSMATQAANSVSVTGGSITGLSSLRVSGQSYEAIGNGTLNVSATTSIFGGGTALTAAVGGVNYWACTSNQFQLSNVITAATCFFGTAWTNISDARIKKDVSTYSLGTAALNQLRPVNYIYNGEYGSPDNGVVQTGLIAQEVLTTPFSSMVGTRVYKDPDTGTETTLYDVNTNQLVFALVNAVKELSARVAELESK
jgi:hypothetical protein